MPVQYLESALAEDLLLSRRSFKHAGYFAILRALRPSWGGNYKLVYSKQEQPLVTNNVPI